MHARHQRRELVTGDALDDLVQTTGILLAIGIEAEAMFVAGNRLRRKVRTRG